MVLNCSFSSEPGEFREINEDDAFGFIYRDVLFLMVADGFGVPDKSIGIPAGFEVTKLVESFIKEFFRFPGEASIRLILEQAMYHVNKTLIAYKKANPELYAGYGSSLTLSAITEDRVLYTAHIGITRLYLARAGDIFQGTDDHNEAAMLLRSGELTEEEYLIDDRRNLVTEGLGIVEDIKIDVKKTNLQKDDLVVLASDGVYRTLGPQRILALILESGELELAVDWIVSGALEEKSPDNLAIAISYIN